MALPNGETRIVPIIGHPTAQVKSPEYLTRAFDQMGRNAISFAMDVKPGDLEDVLSAAAKMNNLDGLVITVPHKRNAATACSDLTARAKRIGAVNVVRRHADGTFYGDQCDGVGFVAAAQRSGCRFSGQHALLLGAGGAGTAIAYAMVDAGISRLDLLDPDRASGERLLNGLRQYGTQVGWAEGDLATYDIVVNASPVGMGSTSSPLDVGALKDGCFVGDVVTLPAETSLIAASRRRGLRCCTGIEMYEAVALEMLAFLDGKNFPRP